MRIIIAPIILFFANALFCQDLINEYSRFDSDLTSIVFLSNAQKLLVGSYDKNIYLINATNAKIEKTFSDHNNFVFTIAYCPKTKTIASAGWDNKIIIRDEASMDIKIEVEAHNDRINALAFSPDGSLLASAADDQNLFVWDTKTGEKIFSITDHKNNISAVTFSKDGKYIASGGWNKNILIHSTKDGKLLKTLKGHFGIINSIDFSFDNKKIVSGANDNTTIVWAIDSAKIIAKFDYFKQPVNRVSFFLGDKYIFCADATGILKIYDISNNFLITQKQLHEGAILDMNLISDKGLLATVGSDKNVKIWNIAEYNSYECMKAKLETIKNLARPQQKNESTENYSNRIRAFNARKAALLRECMPKSETPPEKIEMQKKNDK